MRPHVDAAKPAVAPETLDAVATLTIRVRRVVQGLQGGEHASMHLGASVEFAEHKRYYPGDDIRHIDWRALARTDRYFIKTHAREVILRAILLIDCSPSMAYTGSRAGSSKLDYARTLLGAMGHILVRQGDAVGLLPFSDQPGSFLPPDRRPEHLPALLSRLAVLEPTSQGRTGYAAAIRAVADRAGRRAMIVIATDLLGADRDTEVALAGLAARGHDVVLFQVLSPDELDLPFDRYAAFTGLEGEGSVSLDPALVREDYRRAVEEEKERWRRVAGKAEIDIVFAATDAAPEAVLAGFASRRYRAGSRR